MSCLHMNINVGSDNVGNVGIASKCTIWRKKKTTEVKYYHLDTRNFLLLIFEL